MMMTVYNGSQYGLSLCTLPQAAEVYHQGGALHSSVCFNVQAATPQGMRYDLHVAPLLDRRQEQQILFIATCCVRDVAHELA